MKIRVYSFLDPASANTSDGNIGLFAECCFELQQAREHLFVK